jgi:hypothetical protein
VFTFDVLKRTIASFILFFHLFASFELNQWVKLPFLFEHFLEHQSANQSLGFIEFLHFHYFVSNEQVADHEKDMKLPFKSHEDCTHTISSIFVPLLFNPTIPRFDFQNEIVFFDFSNANYVSAYLSSIWQPPKK